MPTRTLESVNGPIKTALPLSARPAVHSTPDGISGVADTKPIIPVWSGVEASPLGVAVLPTMQRRGNIVVLTQPVHTSKPAKCENPLTVFLGDGTDPNDNRGTRKETHLETSRNQLDTGSPRPQTNASGGKGPGGPSRPPDQTAFPDESSEKPGWEGRQGDSLTETSDTEAEHTTGRPSVLPHEIRRISQLFRNIQGRHRFTTGSFFTSIRRGVRIKGLPLTVDGLTAFIEGKSYLDIRALDEIQRRLENDWVAPLTEDADLREMRMLINELKWAETIQRIVEMSPGDIRKAFGRVLTVLRLAEQPKPLTQREFIEAKQFEGYSYVSYSLLESGKRIPHINHLKMILAQSVLKNLNSNSTAIQLLYLHASNAEISKEDQPNLPMSRDELKTCSLWDLTKYLARVSGLTLEQFANKISFSRSTFVRHRKGEIPDSSEVVNQIKRWLGPERMAMAEIIDQKAAVLASQNSVEIPELPEHIIDEALEEGFVFSPHVEAIYANLPTRNSKSVGVQAREARIEKDLDVRRLATRAKIYYRTLLNIEHGSVIPELITRFRLFRALGYKIHDPEMLDFLFAKA